MDSSLLVQVSAPPITSTMAAATSSSASPTHGVPLQIHTMEGDELGDLDIARDLVETIDGAELFLYPGEQHLFTDNSLPAYDEGAATLLEQRVLSFLDNIALLQRRGRPPSSPSDIPTDG